MRLRHGFVLCLPSLLRGEEDHKHPEHHKHHHKEFDCSGDDESGWSHHQKAFCCKHANKACFDCNEETAGDASTWKAEHLEFCCTTKGVGCQDTRQCSGYEEVFSSCPDAKPCDTCVPVDCRFRDWGDWHSAGGCSGLRMRQRGIDQENNECGVPCAGPKILTEKIDPKDLPEHCLVDKMDCAFGDWGAWSGCSEEETDQTYRTRDIREPARNGGIPCYGYRRETKPCMQPSPKEDCRFADWQEWTPCSVTCGKGHYRRLRIVANDANHGGRPCNGTTLESKTCVEQSCPEADAEVGDWTDWSQCDWAVNPQRFRERRIIKEAAGNGTRFEGELSETIGCPHPLENDCVFDHWGGWSPCSRDCDGGQQYRERKLLKEAGHGGKCPAGVPVKEAKPCNTEPCSAEPKDCKFADWSEWSQCDAMCGQGSQSRQRYVSEHAEDGGLGCHGPVNEVKGCIRREKKHCPKVDCKWSDWTEWNACSCDCGGGQRNRNRVVKHTPKNGGKVCDALDKSEVEACNTQPCSTGCIDGTWHDWNEWSDCSSTCGGGYKSRLREVLQVPNGCGKPLVGPRMEFDKCEAKKPCEEDRDCELNDWSEWSDCSCKCFGIQDRHRTIRQFLKGKGKACEMESMKELRPCHPMMGEHRRPEGCGDDPATDCVLSHWHEWSDCTRSCGGGQRTKERQVVSPSKMGGKPCDSELIIMEGCNEQSCEKEICTDCKWSSWGKWSDCTHCGGQRYRHRSIEQLNNHCGRPCRVDAASEVENCTSHCKVEFTCLWSDWSAPSTCPQTGCGPISATRNRVLGFDNNPALLDKGVGGAALFMAGKGAECSGNELSYESCGLEECDICTPRDCSFSDWEEWGMASCEGLCQRKRSIKESNNECGMPCGGALIESKRCETVCGLAVDCKWGEWSEWTLCNSPYGQKLRGRKVQQAPEFGGKPCVGESQKTSPCYIPEDDGKRDCVLSEWSEYTKCSATCGGGVHSRTRVITQHPEKGGKPCDTKLEELGACGSHECKSSNCVTSQWTEWSRCGPDAQKYRSRQIVADVVGSGTSCEGHLKETATCLAKPTDCKVSDWTRWSDCDKTCGGGQKKRQRQVQLFAANGGEECPTDMIMTEGCNSEPCDTRACEVTDWSEWTKCSEECGPGQKGRTRGIKQHRKGLGQGCTDELEELVKCEEKKCDIQDCEWGEWMDWGDCTCSCGGGQRQRNRHIAKMPRRGGKMCSVGDKEQAEPCNMKPCHSNNGCVDGTWQDWEPWSHCSSTCGGGAKWRRRKVDQTANHCGQEAEGDSHEEAFCNEDKLCEPTVDCEFGDWDAWSECTNECDGVTYRSREILKHGRGEGDFCEGHTKESQKCNPGPGKKPPHDCEAAPAVDCQMSDWSGWDDCTAECDGGEQKRHRKIDVMHRGDGMACQAPLEEVQECNRKACAGPKPVDCELGDWQDWGACTKCNGEMKRYRDVAAYTAHGGERCDRADLEEAAACSLHCEHELFCSWAAWSDWGGCSAKCGPSGQRSRRRTLVASLEAPKAAIQAEGIVAKYAELAKLKQAMKANRSQELVVAFAGGALSLLAGLGVWRVVGSVVKRRHGRHGELQLREADTSSEMELPLNPY
eukprot:TRINITY_DN4747_c0_g4_i1.p1 TRINITY_DN4747_c0_g4~~TRINITY_DN4747_c0_g4_i1.p1  ORF type:complete len:1601 (-),score=442.25 TRINITY_DN4747_c0_g4_i1:271-5073(-)